jgi:hypothetical protein
MFTFYDVRKGGGKEFVGITVDPAFYGESGTVVQVESETSHWRPLMFVPAFL